MKPKANRRTRRRASKPERGGFFIIAAMLALSAFGLWRCMEEGEGPSSPVEQDNLRRRVVIGRGVDVDTTILDEQALLKQAKPQEDSPRPGVKPKAPKAPEEKPAPKTAEEKEVHQDEEPVKPPSQTVPTPEPPRFPLHAVAFQFHTQVRDKADMSARVVGYARRGATFRVSEKIKGSGCDKGWHEIEPGGYFVCAGAGAMVGKEPLSFAPSPARARLDAQLPYDYSYIATEDAVQFWKVPTAEEETAAKEALDQAEASGEELDREALASVLARARSMDEEQPEAPPAESGGASDTTATDSATPSKELPSYVHMRLRKGFFLSTDGALSSPTGSFVRTVRGRFVRGERLTSAKPSSFAGALLGRNASLPLAFVVGSGASYLTRASSSSPLKNGTEAPRYQRLSIEQELVYKGKRYVAVGQNRYLPAKVIAVAHPATPPSDLVEEERWIDIDLAEQTLVAYEGLRPVFATLVSTGRPGYETPKGSFRIYGKHVTITMDDTAAGDEAYSIEDVPWTQFFKDSFALHAAFWHDRFGKVKSHGCVNLSPADARRLFQWTGPHVPSGMHGVIASKGNPGTRVVIH
ncbi:MAG: L,D-transpeptidase family protein [Myxococcota bacterium]|nr:L,D-transpeptidase family protein [Myxococcota bacterium]